jgi:rhodanese-related sulfurtransferase
MQQLTPHQLKQWLEDSKDFLLIDVREYKEHETYNIGGQIIPLGSIITRKDELPIDKDIVVYCEKGIRSVIAIQRLEANGFHQLFNLSGGIKAWKDMNFINIT